MQTVSCNIYSLEPTILCTSESQKLFVLASIWDDSLRVGMIDNASSMSIFWVFIEIKGMHGMLVKISSYIYVSVTST